MASRHRCYKVHEVKSLHPKEEQERVFVERINQTIGYLGQTVSDIGGVPSLPPALGKLVLCAAEAADALRKCEDVYLRSRK